MENIHEIQIRPIGLASSLSYIFILVYWLH